jgi:hypothetical protein
MSKLENWGDLFKFNKELLDDDFNAGQKFVIKAKRKSDDGLVDLSTTTKLGNPDNSNECKFTNELKFKGTCGPDTHDVSIN